ncbi:alpha/beta hydrolase family protein [Pedobacter aquatilis]|uniref:alpha/beta hydrolase family protein n=1 Tax=Pedobacter aquatilis TaxID=351343 RepID=UPI00292E78A0|nr:prolyl oligopeptidase family serine peptidase [Pedobacter aquatilis]
MAFILLNCSVSFAQRKPIIDVQAIKIWPEVSKDEVFISARGKYVSYVVRSKFQSELITKSIKNDQVKSMNGSIYQPCMFVGDEYFLFKKQDSLFVLDLRTFSIKYLTLLTGSVERQFGNTYEVRLREISANGTNETVILDLKTGIRRQVANAIRRDEDLLLKTNAQGINSVWISDKSGNLIKTGDDRTLQATKGLKINAVNGILPSGALNLTLSRVSKDLISESQKQSGSKVKLTLWSYTDRNFQAQQEKSYVEKPKIYQAFMLRKSGEIVQVEDERFGCKDISGVGWLVYDKRNIENISTNPFRERIHYYSHLVFSDGKKIELSNLDSTAHKEFYMISSNSRYLVYFNYTVGNYYSYDVRNRKTINLTQGLLGFRSKAGVDTYNSRPSHDINFHDPDPVSGISTITANDRSRYVISDGYDFWKLDPSGKNAPICLTNHYGRKNNIVFRITLEGLTGKIIKWGDKILFRGFNSLTKEDGFFALSLEKSMTPEMIVYDHAMISMATGPIHPVKASNANVLLYAKSYANKSVNWFITDGKIEQQISDVCPEKNYNWMTSELINWKSENGFPLQGILYKPEDFDANKKYPMIINFYEMKSDLLHEFHKPGYIFADIDIPWLVSRGYLVFLPDMKFRLGEAGKSALEALESGTDELCTRPYIDKKHIGIAGHSFGGFESAYFVTHTTRYKAALVSAAITDVIARYNNPSGGLGSESGSQTVEWSQGGIGTTLWDRPEQFIENSAIFNLDKVTTPVLMMHNDKDNAVPFSQGLEMFSGLYRLGKPAWLLQYEGTGHILNQGGNEETKLDFTTRVTQFFDHYLKGAPAPLWMLDGIPFKDRGKKTGLELGTLGRTPGKSPLVSDVEQKLIDEYSKIPLSEKLKRLKD